MPDTADETLDLIRHLYAQPDGEAGGPLHVFLDDFNLEYVEPWDGIPSYPGAPIATWDPETVRLANEIADRMRPMTLAQRGAVLAKHWGFFDRQPPKSCPFCFGVLVPVSFVIVRTDVDDPDERIINWGCHTHTDRMVEYQASIGVPVVAEPLSS